MNGKNAKPEKQRSPSALEESPAIHTRAEEKQAEERLAIGPQIVYETIRREGEEGIQAVFASTGMVRIRGGTFQRIFTVAEAPLAAHLPMASWTSRFQNRSASDRLRCRARRTQGLTG